MQTPRITTRIRRAASFSNVVAMTALVTAMGGTAYAAATIGSAQIIDDSVRSIDVKNSSLASADYNDGSVKSADIFNGGVTSTDLANGGVQAVDLAPTALDSVRTTFRVEGTATQVAGSSHASTQVLCDYENGELASGGGGYSYYIGKGNITGSSVVFGQGEYSNQPIGWEVKMQNLQAAPNFIIIRAICAKG